MYDLTPTEASQVAFAVLQAVRARFEDQRQLTAAAVATLLASLSVEDIRQSDLPGIVKNVDAGGVSKQLDIFEGRRKTNPQPALILRHVDDMQRRSFIIETTKEGQAFKRHLANVLNKELETLHKHRSRHQ